MLLETPRLILRRFRDADCAAFLAYRNDPEVARYQSWESYSAEEASGFVEQQQHLQPGTPGQWFQFAIESKEHHALVGDCAFKINADDALQAEIGFTLARQYQGKGYAAEAVARLLDYGFIELQLHRIVAITDCENHPSVKLLERLGMRREGHFIQHVWFKGRWGDEYLYAMLRDEWMRQHDKST